MNVYVCKCTGKKPERPIKLCSLSGIGERTENIFTLPILHFVIIVRWACSTFVMKSITKEQNGGKMPNVPARGPT